MLAQNKLIFKRYTAKWSMHLFTDPIAFCRTAIVPILDLHNSIRSVSNSFAEVEQSFVRMGPVAEPPSKRVRFDPSLPPVATSSTGAMSVKLDGNDVIQLRFVERPEDLHEDGARGSHSPDLTARPKFTHQIFPTGLLGIKAATAALYYTCASLHCWVDCYVSALESDQDPEKSPPDRDGAVEKSGPDTTPPAEESATELSIRTTVSTFIHAGQVASREEFLRTVEEDAKYVPPVAIGDPILSYSVAGKSGNRKFSVFHHSLVSSSDIREYHRRMQLLMFLYIDGASFIDDMDPRWELFVVLQHVDGLPKYLVGYATVYPFSAMRPGKTLNEGFAERIRISQVFIIPRYQRGGHGGRLLSAIYQNARQRDAFEVTVEDPSDGFRILRDITDLPRAYSNGILDQNAAPEPELFSEISNTLRDQLLLTKAQARRCLEVHCLRFVDRENPVAYKQYRLWVKRRLYEEYIEVLDAFAAGDDRKAKLAEIYEDYEREYLSVVNRIQQKLVPP